MSSSTVELLAEKIHRSETRIVLATAGGTRAISDLLIVPGASRTVLEAVVPYSAAALGAGLGAVPEQSCSARTVRAMAMAGYMRARRLDPGGAPLAGVAATASLASGRPKRGPHRVHVAFQTITQTVTASLELTKGARTRAEEETVTGRMLVNMVAAACGLDDRVEPGLLEGEEIQQTQIEAPIQWQELLDGRRDIVRHGPVPDRPMAVFPGAFNPLHEGHHQMAAIARQRLGEPVAFELSIENVDKPPLDYYEIQQRLGQFGAEVPVVLTRAARFTQKAALFPGATFVVGADTIARIGAAEYYSGDPRAVEAAITVFKTAKCRFLVFGRAAAEDKKFQTLADLPLPRSLVELCTEVPEDQFRADTSSTELRKAQTDEQDPS